MLVVLLIRCPAARLFGAGTAYALWLLPALRLVAPPLPSFAPETLTSLTLVLAVEDVAPLPPDGGPGQWVPLLLTIWVGGAAIFLAWQLIAYRRFLRRLDASASCLGAHRGLSLIESEVEGPLALGLFRRRIVVPVDFERRYSPAERRLALDHEAVHHRRGDLWWNHVGLVILALNWFNPLAWAAWRAFRADQELACDAAVTVSALPEERQDYARALIKSASRPGLIAACPLNHANQLKRRLKMMKTHKTSRLRLLGGTAAVTALIAVGLAVGSPGFAAQQGEAKEKTKTENSERRVERIIIRTEREGDGHRAEHRDHADGDGDREVRRVIERTRDGDGEHAGGDGEHRSVLTMRLDDRDRETLANCAGGQRSEVDEGDGNQRTRVVLCSRGDATPAERAERLQGVRDRLANDSELSAEQRERVRAALEREITRLRGQ